MQLRPNNIYFALAGATTALGCLTDVALGSFGSRLGFTGMYSAAAAALCGGLLWAAQHESNRLRLGKLVVGVVSVLIAFNFMRLSAKWSGDAGSVPIRSVFAGAVAMAWMLALGVLLTALAPRAQKDNKPSPILLRFGSLASAMAVLVVIVAVRGFNSPAVSMAKDLLNGDARPTATAVDADDRAAPQDFEPSPGQIPSRVPAKVEEETIIRGIAPDMAIGPVT